MSLVRKIICTHSGPFHCDDVLACCLIKFLPVYKDAQIIRTRDEELIKSADIVLDVGGEYNPEKLRFDHHQRGFDLTLKDLNPKLDHTIKLSSAGLVYHHFGREILNEALKLIGSEVNEAEKLDVFYENVYNKFVKEIDGVDNGITIAENPKYEIHTGISSRIAKMNLNWNEKQTDERFLVRFLAAMDYIREEFLAIVKYLNNIWWPARDIVAVAIKDRFTVDESGSIIEITTDIVPPYLKFLFMLEKEFEIEGQIKYCIFKDNDVFRVRAIPISDESFILKVPLLEQWRGLRDLELEAVSGIKDVIFVHSTGFIGGAKTREAALQMARLTLESNDNELKQTNGNKKQKI